MSIPFIVAVALLLGLLFVFFQRLRQFGRVEWRSIPRWQKGLRISAALIPLILAGLLFWGFVIEPNRLVVHYETVKIENWPTGLSFSGPSIF